jgi:inositol transport system substrate-binding protein
MNMKFIKSTSIVLLSVMLLIVLAACGSNTEAPSSSTPAADTEKKIKIGVTYQNLQNEFIINIQDKLRARAEEMGVELIEVDGQGKAENQIAQVENFISQKVDAIILNPFDRDGSAPAVDKAVAANIPIIVVNAQVSNLDKATAYVGSDDEDAGRIEMQYMADQLGGKGNIVIIHGANGHSAEVGRTKGNREVLAKYPDIKVLAEQTGNWDRAQSLTLMENWLQKFPDIDGVVAQNDEEGLGAYKAIEAAGRQDEIIVVGIDAIPDALEAVEAGEFGATVFQDAGGQGAGAVDIAIKAINGEKVEPITYIPFQLVTKENLADFKK